MATFSETLAASTIGKPVWGWELLSDRRGAGTATLQIQGVPPDEDTDPVFQADLEANAGLGWETIGTFTESSSPLLIVFDVNSGVRYRVQSSHATSLHSIRTVLTG